MLVLLNGLQAGNRSGTGLYTVQLARWLPCPSVDLNIAVIWPKGVPHPRLPAPAREAFLLRKTGGALGRLLYEQWGIRRDQIRLKANLVHFPANFGSLFGAHNMVVTIHDLSFLHCSAWFRLDRVTYYRLAIRNTVRRAARIIADSHSTAADLRDKLGVSPNRIDVIPLGVDERFQPAAEEARHAVRIKYGLPKHFFLFVGTLEPRKNLPRLIAAWSHTAARCPWHLVIAGRDGWKTGAIRRAAARSRDPARVHFPGFISQEDLPAVLSAADAFVWPSLWEGFGLPPLEAMACGVPVMISNVSSLPEVVGDAALQVDPYDVSAMADAMTRLFEDETLRAALRAKGRTHAVQYTWQRTAAMTLDVYRKVLGI